MEANIELKSVTADVVVIDYSTGSIDFIELPIYLQKDGVQSEEIEEYLDDVLGYHMSDIYWMGSGNSGEFQIHYEKAR